MARTSGNYSEGSSKQQRNSAWNAATIIDVFQWSPTVPSYSLLPVSTASSLPQRGGLTQHCSGRTNIKSFWRTQIYFIHILQNQNETRSEEHSSECTYAGTVLAQQCITHLYVPGGRGAYRSIKHAWHCQLVIYRHLVHVSMLPQATVYAGITIHGHHK